MKDEKINAALNDKANAGMEISKDDRDTGKAGKKRHKKFWLILLIVLAVLILPGLYCGLTVRHYTIEDKRITSRVRIALITDLHSCRYGEKESGLLEAIYEQAPDVVLLGGDIFDDERPDTESEYLLAGLKDHFPCYYVTGNHECWASPEAHRVKMELIEKYGIKRLRGDAEILTLNGNKIRICGVDDPDLSFVRAAYSEEDYDTYYRQLPGLKEETADDIFTVLLVHRPENYADYQKYGFDLVLSGHAHGGQWRIPGILNGLYAPSQGLFPKYAGG